MRTVSGVVLLAVVSASPLARANDGWRATAALAPDSPITCRQADVSKMYFDFRHTDSELSVQTTGGKTFRAPVAADGSVKATVTVPVGARNFAIDVIGNARTRVMEAINTQYACRFKLTPAP